jgi:hypothetical protein
VNVRLVGQLPGFGVVDNQTIDDFDGSINCSFIEEIQKFIVSIATNSASAHCSRTCF